jgi:putative hydrolase of the HAD superfamily
MSQIQAVIFDIGNVLLTFDYFIAERALVAHTGIEKAPSVEDLHPLRIDHETGRIPREDFVRIVREAFSHDGPEDHFLELWTGIFQVNEPMVQWARSLHGKVPLYLLSNIGCIHHDHIFGEYDFFGTLFDDGVYSYKAGVMKPERRIFEIARTQFGVDPSRTLYIDDLEENVRGAEEAGFVGHHYDPSAHHRLEERISSLQFGDSP